MPLDIIVKFVERKISTDVFLDNLYSDEGLEKILSEDIFLLPFTYLGQTAYLYLLDQDLNTPGGLLITPVSICMSKNLVKRIGLPIILITLLELGVMIAPFLFLFKKGGDAS